MPHTHNPPGRRTSTMAALYACEPDPDVRRGMLAAAAAIAERHGWTVVADGRIEDDCLLTRPPQSRPGWDSVRTLAEQHRINAIVVPALGHIGFTWEAWQAEQRFLHRHGVSVASVEPMVDALLAGVRR
ncbi:hypothetical protein [Streptomyces sp. NPDC050600]|uniref:hypothetical protein n=1 Tax=Streptomyces sp. NPDC050600 TaxID=3157213 RepID=UPI003426F88A